MASHAIEIRNLYKIFGPRRDYVEQVRNGLGKAELIEKHRHVLGLQDISMTMPPARSLSSWACPGRASRRSSDTSTA